MGKEQSMVTRGQDGTVESERVGRRVVAKSMPRFAVAVSRVVLGLLLVIGFCLSMLPWGRAAVRAAFLLPALVSGTESSSLTFMGDSVHFSRRTISSVNGPIFLDIYEPATPPALLAGGRAAIIDIAGVGDNRNDPQLINFARSFAREGILFVNMGTPTLFNFVVSTQDSEAVVETFQYIAHWPGVDPQRIGIVGLSAGSTLACLAATDPRIRDRLAFITLFGGYFDAQSMLGDIGRHAQMVDGQLEPWLPTYVPKQVLSESMSSALSPTENALFQQTFVQNGKPLSNDEVRQLSASAAAVYHLLQGDEPLQVVQNQAKLSPTMKRLLVQLSPGSMIGKIHTPIYLLHSRDDQYVPFTQSRAFAAALAHIHHPYDFAEFGIFSHVEVRTDLAFGQLLGDGMQMLRILDEMLLPASR